MNGTCGDREHSSGQLYSTSYRGSGNKQPGKSCQKHTQAGRHLIKTRATAT